MMRHGVVTTRRGVVVEGRLIVLAEENDGLIFVGDEFLDDVLRERFGTPAGDGRALVSAAPVEVPHVRIVIEASDRTPAGSGGATICQTGQDGVKASGGCDARQAPLPS